MSAYEIKLDVIDTMVVGLVAPIVVRDPLWPADEIMSISPDIMSVAELRYEVERIKKALDKVLETGKRRFAKWETETFGERVST